MPPGLQKDDAKEMVIIEMDAHGLIGNYIDSQGALVTGSIRAVIFDLDDTLLDRHATQIRMAKHIAERFSAIFQGINTESIVSAFLQSDLLATADFYSGKPSGGSREQRFGSFLKLLGISEDCATAMTEEYMRAYPPMCIPMAGAVQVVLELAGRFPIGIVSNGLPDVQYKKIEAIGLDRAFSCVVLSEEIGIRKPDPEIFLRAARLLRVPPVECLYVGDSYPHDIVGAKAAGMNACWFKSGSSPSQNTDAGADFTIANIAELIGILDNAG